MPDNQQSQQQDGLQPGGAEQTVDIPIVGEAYSLQSLNMDCQTCVNFYLIQDETGKSASALFPTPGLTLFASIAGASNVRGFFETAGVVYVVIDNTLYTLNMAGVLTSLGTINSSTGSVMMIANTQGGVPTQIMISDHSGTGYVYKITENTLVTITDANFLGCDYLCYFNGVAVFNNPGLNQFQVSDPENFLGYSTSGAPNVASMESGADPIIAIKPIKLELYIYSNKGAEIWIANSTGSFPFQRNPTYYVTQGLAARDTVTAIDNSLYWLAQTEYGTAYAVFSWFDINQQRISNDAVESEISTYGRVNNAKAFACYFKNNLFYVLIFPTADVTWVYNANIKKWAKWSSQTFSNLYGRHLSNSHCFAFNKHLVGDFQTGSIYFLDENNHTDNSTQILRERTTRHVFKLNKNVVVSNFQINFQDGSGLSTGQGSAPVAMLQFSTDNGHTWSKEIWQTIGKKGEYKNRAVWLRLGMGRDWVFRVRVSDPVKWVIIGCSATVSVGDS